MTDSGNHGGASVEETDSGVFFYSTTPLFSVKKSHIHSLETDSETCQSVSNTNNNKDDNTGEKVFNQATIKATKRDDSFIKEDNSSNVDMQQKLSWNNKLNKFEWETLKNLRQNPRIVSQV